MRTRIAVVVLMPAAVGIRRGGAAVGSPGVLSGSLFHMPVNVPVNMPVQVCGVSAWPGRGSPVRVRAMPTCAV